MQLPFCKICGERHSLGFCPDFGPLLQPRPVQKTAEIIRTEPEPPPLLGRRFTPDDMKQEAMPVVKPRFDRNAYQRELMRQRRNRQ